MDLDRLNRSVGDRHPFQAGSIPPQTLEVVVIACLGLEDVNHEVPVVHQDPFGLGQPLVPQWLATVLLQQFLHPLRQRLYVRAGGPGGDHEYLGNDEEVTDLEQRDVEPLLIGDGVGSQPGCCNCVYGNDLLRQSGPKSLGQGEGNPRGLYGEPVRQDFTPLLSSRETMIAVIGASDNLEKYGSIIYRDLKARGYHVFAVNPSRDSVDDDPCYPTLRDLPERPDIIDFVVPAHIGIEVARTAAALSMNNLWLQPGAESAELIDYLEGSGLDYDYDSCIMVSARHALRR